MKPSIRATLAAVFIALFVGVGSAALAPSIAQAPAVTAEAARQHGVILAPGGSDMGKHGQPANVRYTATAYCQRGTTRSGVDTHAGIAAADPSVLPVGSVVRIDSPLNKYDGVYTVLDTGSKVLGRHVDLFMRDCREALQFGKQPIRVKVIRKGWSPKATAAGVEP